MAEAGASRGWLVTVALLWATVMAGAGSMSGCYGHNCDGDIQTYGRSPGEGELVTPDLWESSPADGTYIPYPRQRLWFFQIRPFDARRLAFPIPYISADPNPAAVGGNLTIGSGNLAEISGIGPGTVAIKNDTCADYYLRLVVQAEPIGPATDANADASADPGDAGTD